MHISDNGLHFIEGWEGFSSVPYRDVGGVPTIGFGTTSADVSPLPRHVTRDEAEALLRRKIQTRYEPAVNGTGVPLSQNQFDALVSLCYNCGPGAMQWQIGRDVRAEHYSAAADDFMRYVYVNGAVCQGLVNRRRAERTLYLSESVDPYERFPDSLFALTRKSLADHPAVLQTFKGPVLELNERGTVREYDRLMKDPDHNAAEIKKHRLWLLMLRKRIWTVAHRDLETDGKPSWGRFARGWRWQQLNKRTKGMD